MLPLCCILYRLRTLYIGHHDYALRLPTEVAIQTFVAGIHSDEVPHFKAHLVPLHHQLLELIVRPDRRLITLVESITDESIDDRCLANGRVSEHDNLER